MNAQEILLNSVPDENYVFTQLDTNNEALLRVAQTLANAVVVPMNENVDRLQRVEKRIRSSVNGHLRRMVQLGKPIVESIVTPIYNGMDEIQAGINLIGQRPEVAAWIKRTETPANWWTVLPNPPQPGDLAQGGEGLQTITDDFRPKGKLTSYQLWYHCQLRQAIGVPSPSADDVTNLEVQGWKRFPSPQTVWMRDAHEVELYLQSQQQQILALCRAG